MDYMKTMKRLGVIDCFTVTLRYMKFITNEEELLIYERLGNKDL